MKQDQLPKTGEMDGTRDVAEVGDLGDGRRGYGDDGDDEDEQRRIVRRRRRRTMMMECVEMCGAGEVGLKPGQA